MKVTPWSVELPDGRADISVGCAQQENVGFARRGDVPAVDRPHELVSHKYG